MGAQLERSGIIRSRYAFELMRFVKHGTLKAGEYRFDHPTTVAEVYERLQRDDVYTVAVTIPEGANIYDIAQRLEEAKLGTRDEFLSAAVADVHLIQDIDSTAPSLEGYLFPDTYHLQRKASADKIAAAMVKRFRGAAASIGLTSDFHRVVTLASIVEKETGRAADRPLIAAVFINRMRQSLRLQTDPTVIYGLGEHFDGSLHRRDLDTDQPFNTYTRDGLPPTPIAMPSQASLDAVLHPPSTPYLYFVARGDGSSEFSANIADHNRAVAKYQKRAR